MIIHPPTVQTKGSELCVTSRIEIENRPRRYPHTLWFRVPTDHRDHVTESIDAFVVTLFTLAMHLGEDVEVRGRMPARLLEGIEAYQRRLHSWLPQFFSRVAVRAEGERSASRAAGGIASAFSGGIDSFYSLSALRDELSHTLFIHGFDIPYTNKHGYQKLFSAYDALMASMGVSLLRVATNARRFFRHVNWEIAHGSVLIGTAFLFDRVVSRFYVPSSYTSADAQTYVWGSHPLLDHLLSSDNLEVSQHGVDKTRLEKTAAIADRPETYSRLRICWKASKGIENCCRCNDCLKAMVDMELLGVLDRYHVFPAGLRRRHLRLCRFYRDEIGIAEQIVERALSQGRTQLAADVRCAIRHSRRINWLEKIAVKGIEALRLERLSTTARHILREIPQHSAGRA